MAIGNRKLNQFFDEVFEPRIVRTGLGYGFGKARRAVFEIAGQVLRGHGRGNAELGVGSAYGSGDDHFGALRGKIVGLGRGII